MSTTILVIIAIFSSPILLFIAKSSEYLIRSYYTLVLLLAFLNITNQLAPISLFITAISVSVALLLLCITLLLQNIQKHFFHGILIGLIVDAFLHMLFLTWDYTWQKGNHSLITSIVLSSTLLFLRDQATLSYLRPGKPVFDLEKFRLAPKQLPFSFFFVITSFFSLQILFLGNTAFIASSCQVSIFTANFFIIIVYTLNLILPTMNKLKTSKHFENITMFLLSTLLSLGFYILLTKQNIYFLLVVFFLQCWLIYFLKWNIFSFDIQNNIQKKNKSFRPHFFFCALSWLLFATIIFLFQVHYEMNLLPFPNVFVPILVTILLTYISYPKKHSSLYFPVRHKPLLCFMAMFFAMINFLPYILQEYKILEKKDDKIRLVNYNVHEAVNPYGILDPEAIAQVITAQNPDVIVLQEVGRGWMISSGIDLVEWLSFRLKMKYVYAPAADGQFGNVIFTRLPIKSYRIGKLPQENTSMARSYVLVNIEYFPGEECTIVGTHLQHRKKNTPIRMKQIETLLDLCKNIKSRLIITGDFNAIPGSPEISLFSRFINAQDETRNSKLFTANSISPSVRIDWIFGLPDTIFSDFVIPKSTASDHLPVVATIQFKPQ